MDFNKNKFIKPIPTRIAGDKVLNKDNHFERTRKLLDQKNNPSEESTKESPADIQRRLSGFQKKSFRK